ncbi:hypothetical protein Rsub_07567 [Raphidocelis subcapitata]|uniref:FAD-binding PCMH-type domain-containing protein n=1 Tax=Raphidocelis subcapitata TaxID=307507 RepID=A0A2V0P5E3_9CHLO|nr:hypothetical protein Rsub_07567 [Raphidocelis subcapitata]|eukprot:GBF95066.1 hypothetical protein Rsub_07567 [Raphidocelis subcapitata]
MATSFAPRRAPNAVAVRALTLALVAVALPAPRPARADGGSYASVYGRVGCAADAVVTPSSTQELADAIKSHATAAKAAGAALKIRATHAVFHSSSSFPCVPPSPASPLPCALSGSCGRGVAVFTDRLAGVLGADAGRRRLRVQAGIKVAELLAECKRRGWAPPIGAGTTYGGLTLGGVLATNAHDSAYNGPSTLAHIVTELTWVDAAGTIHTSPRDSDDARALLGGIGLVGIIAEVEVALQGTTNATPHLSVTWHPDIGLYSTFTKEATGEASTGARLSPLATMQPFEAPLLDAALKAWDGDVNDVAGPVFGAVGCLSTFLTSPTASFISVPVGLPPLVGSVPGLAIPVSDGVGDANDMLGCSCGGLPCAWDNGGPAAVEPREFVIELSDLGGWIADTRRVYEQELKQGGGGKRCLLGFVMFQFGSGSDAWLATTSGMREPVHVITMLTKSRALSYSLPAKFGFVHDILEQMSLCKYGGRPHPGKNSERTFTHPGCPLADRYPQMGKLLEAQARYDPGLVFEPPLFARIKAREGFRLSPGCDLRKECFCSEDAHCAAGFSCVPSRAFPQFRACKPPALI